MCSSAVLIMEDNAVDRQMLADLLEHRGYVVLQADSASAGIALARSRQPQLILMDLALPGMDGLQATREIKASEATRHIPVIAVSAHATAADRKRALASGCCDFISKPIDTRALAATVAQYIRP